jgi:SAM-dependent methyltransferase
MCSISGTIQSSAPFSRPEVTLLFRITDLGIRATASAFYDLLFLDDFNVLALHGDESVKILNLGCGTDIRPGCVNLDRAALPGVDVVHNLDVLPLPFAERQFDHIVAKDVLEHVDYVNVLRELHRILKPGGTLFIQVPHFTSVDNYIDPTHRHRFSVRTFDFFVSDGRSERAYYFDFSFASVAARRLTFFRGPLLWDYLLQPLVNSHRKLQKYYELTFLSRLFPAQNLELTLRR